MIVFRCFDVFSDHGVIGMHVLPAEEGLPDLPEEGSMVKKDPSEEGEGLAPMSPTSASTPNGNTNGATSNGLSANEQSTIKANKGMILRKVMLCAIVHTLWF